MRYAATFIIYLVTAAAGCGDSPASQEASQQKAQLVFRAQDGRQLTVDDLADATGTFNYQIVTGMDIPAKASELQDKARRLGAAGEYERAIEVLSRAQSLAPDWPYPTYDMAFTYLMMRDFVKAREHYEKTVKLSPRGFFTALTALDTLNRETTGELPEGTYAAYVSLEWIDDTKQRAELVAALVDRLPRFAPAWKEFALQCDDPSEKLDAIEKGLAANPDAETHGVLLVNKALTLNEQGDIRAAKEILGNLALDSKTTFANVHIAKQALAGFIE